MTFERGERRGADKLRVTFTGPVEDVAIISGRPPSPGRATAQDLAPAGRPVSQDESLQVACQHMRRVCVVLAGNFLHVGPFPTKLVPARIFLFEEISPL